MEYKRLIGIYGAGKMGRLLFKYLKQKNERIHFFVDKFKQGYIEDIPIIKPKDIPINAKIYVAIPENDPKPRPKLVEDILGNSHFFSIRELEWLKIQKNLKLIPFYKWIFSIPSLIEEYYSGVINWLFKPFPKLIDEKTYSALQKFFSDEKSLLFLEMFLKMRENPEKYYIIHDIEPEFFPSDIIPYWLESIKFVDCGSYIGDTIVWLVGLFGNRVEQVYAFGPLSFFDKKVYKNIVENVNKLREKFDFKFILFPAGIWNENTFLEFSIKEGGASYVKNGKSKEGKIKIPVFKLDSILLDEDINFIKMNIEGAEMEALEGAKEIIKKKMPILAICIYHKPQHFWQIPFWIKQNFPDYKLFLRIHTPIGIGTVLYCIPPWLN